MKEETKLAVEIEGIRPLLMHNGDMADPENEYVKEIATIQKKRSKNVTPVDRARREWLDFRGGLYWNPEAGLHVPSDNIERCVQLGAQKSMLGKKVQSCVFVTTPLVPVIYDGPREPDPLYKAGFFLRKSVMIGKARVFRVRPMISGWKLRFELWYDDSIVSIEELKQAVIDAGALIGLGDWRPKFGRFTCLFI